MNSNGLSTRRIANILEDYGHILYWHSINKTTCIKKRIKLYGKPCGECDITENLLRCKL